MVVVWEDEFYNTDKMRISPDTRERLIHLTDEGLVMADPIADYTDCNDVGDVEAFFDDQDIYNGSGDAPTYSTTDPPAGASDRKSLKFTIPAGLAKGIKLTKINSSGPWDDFEASVYMHTSDYDSNCLGRLTITLFPLSAPIPNLRYTIKIDKNLDGTNFLVSTSTDGDYGGDFVSSGITIPTNDEWVKLTIKKDGNRIYYIIDKTSTGSSETSAITPVVENMYGPVYMQISSHCGNAGAKEFWWDLAEIRSHLEQHDTRTHHQHEFETVNINPSNFLYWRKIVLTKSGQNLESRKMITCSVLNGTTGSVISGYENLTDDEINLKSVTENPIRFKIKFWNYEDYDSPILSKLRVEYETSSASGDVTLDCTANTYNDDVVEPILTKTGYRLTFEATGVPHDDPDIDITHYWFDFGDGMNTGWITHNIVNHIYTKHSQNIAEAGADQEWNARVRMKYSNDEISGWSTYVDVMVLNEKPEARLWVKPVVARMSGAGPGADIKFFGTESFDYDDNGTIRTSGGYKFDYGDGTPQSWQDANYATHEYTSEDTYTVGLIVRDDLDVESDKITTKVYIKPALSPTTIVFNTKPRQAVISISAPVTVSHTIAGGFPEVETKSQKNRTISIEGQANEVETDIDLLQGYVENYTLVKFEYEDVLGATKNFVGYILKFTITRTGGFYKYAPWTMDLQYVEV